jgi:hypothetical protein
MRSSVNPPMAEMAALGVRLFTDDGTGVQDNRLMRRALEYGGGLGVTDPVAGPAVTIPKSAGFWSKDAGWDWRPAPIAMFSSDNGLSRKEMEELQHPEPISLKLFWGC